MANAINSLNYGNNTYTFTLPYGVCETAGDTVAKTVTVDNFSLEEGAVVIVKFTNANSVASPTLNVNGTGAKPIYRYGTTTTSTGTTTTGWVAGAVQMLTYDGTGWIRDYWNNTTYSNASLGHGYATCSTAAETTAKVATLSSYKLATGGFVSVRFTYGVPANSTLNINSTGAKAIYYRNAKITDGVIKAGDIATFVYSTYYRLISIDRWQEDAEAAITGLSVSGKTITYTKGDGTTGTITTQDTDTNTHYTSKNVVGATSATSNTTTALTNGNVYLNSVENGDVTSTHKISGSGATTVTTDTSGNIIISSTDNNTTYSAAGSSLGLVKTGGDVTISAGVITVNDGSHNHAASNITSGTIAAARLPAASGTQSGITIVYPAASCTTFSSDTGTVTPLAVQKGAKMFAIPRVTSTEHAVTRFTDTEGAVENSKIIIEDVTNTRDTSKTANVLAIPAEGGKKMVYGYCTDQVDGTSFIGGVFDADATEYPYSAGLAIGGTSGNLLWKGDRVATATDLNGKAASSHTHNYAGSSSAGGAATTALACSGNSATATKLATAVNINGVSFDGSANITIPASPVSFGVTTAGTGAAYTATVDGITSLAVGASFIMIPHTISTAVNPTLNVNGLGAKQIRRRMSHTTYPATMGYSAGWLIANRPIRLVYDGSYWIADLPRPSASDLNGTVAVANGGTGISSVTAGNFLLGNGTAAMTEKTPETWTFTLSDGSTVTKKVCVG